MQRFARGGRALILDGGGVIINAAMPAPLCRLVHKFTYVVSHLTLILMPLDPNIYIIIVIIIIT